MAFKNPEGRKSKQTPKREQKSISYGLKRSSTSKSIKALGHPKIAYIQGSAPGGLGTQYNLGDSYSTNLSD